MKSLLDGWGHPGMSPTQMLKKWSVSLSFYKEVSAHPSRPSSDAPVATSLSFGVLMPFCHLLHPNSLYLYILYF